MGLLDVSNLQVNYRGPQAAGGALFFVKEQQMGVEWLAQEADNWTLESQSLHNPDLSPPGAGGMAAWVPTGTVIKFSNVDDPARFRATYIIQYHNTQPYNVNAAVLSNAALLSTSFLSIMGFPNPLAGRQREAIALAWLLAGRDINYQEDVYYFAWTPGMGDGFAAQLPSYFRAHAAYVDYLVSQGQARYIYV